MPFEEIEQFYLQRLSDLGFRVRNDGIGQLAPPVATLLGLAGKLTAEHPGEGPDGYRHVVVQLRTEEGWLVKTRLGSLSWRRSTPSVQPAVEPR